MAELRRVRSGIQSENVCTCIHIHVYITFTCTCVGVVEYSLCSTVEDIKITFRNSVEQSFYCC